LEHASFVCHVRYSSAVVDDNSFVPLLFETQTLLQIMAQQLEFAVGAAVILAPQYGIPVFLASALGKLVFKSRKHDAPGHLDERCDSNGKQRVSLQWSHISCSITTKKGEVKQLLQEQSAIAKPNR